MTAENRPNPIIAMRAEFADTIAELRREYPTAEVDVVTDSTICVIQVQGIGKYAYGVGNWSDGLLWSNDPNADTLSRNVDAEPGWTAWAVHDTYSTLEPLLYDEPVIFDYVDPNRFTTFASASEAVADVQRMIREQYTRRIALNNAAERT